MITDFVHHHKAIFHRKFVVVVFMASLKLTTEWPNHPLLLCTPVPAELIKCGNIAFYCAYLFRVFFLSTNRASINGHKLVFIC